MNTEAWESGELGQDADSVAVSPVDAQEVDDALELQLISIRLQKKLIHGLKAIANHHGIGYQPMIRDLLNRFVQSELKMILNQRLREIEAEEQESETESTVPVNEFLRRHA